MNIAISGASGFIGSYISEKFRLKGHVIFPLTRDTLSRESQITNILSQSDVVINLAGAPINHRWTKSYKQELYDSRIKTTRVIVDTINKLHNKPKLLISASAVGYYPPEGCYDEYNQKKGSGFLSDLCQKWEYEASRVSSSVRLATTRFGVVLAANGGALIKMMLPAKFGIATIIGNGNQYFPWIDIVDLADAFEYIIHNDAMIGDINLVAPEHTTNKELMTVAAGYYRSFLKVRIPSFVFRALLGEAAASVLKGQCVVPLKLLQSGFAYKSHSISDFYHNLSTHNYIDNN